MTPAEIAARLTPAQREALMAVCTTHYRPVPRKHLTALGAHWRFKLLMQSERDWTLSETGDQVRAILAQEAQRDG